MKPTKKSLAYIMVALAITTIIAWRLLSVHEPHTNRTGEIHSPAEESHQQQNSTQTFSRNNITGQTQPTIDDILLSDLQPRSTMEDIQRTGLPMMTNPRRASLEMVMKSQTTSELIKDMGNSFIYQYSRIDDTLGVGLDGYTSLSHSPLVIRLIQEGRSNPDQVTKLLEDEISAILNEYESVRLGADVEEENMRLRLKPPVVVSSIDPYYQAHHRYENPFNEINRMNLSLNTAFFVLANIDGLNNMELFEEWHKQQKTSGAGGRDMEAWFIDQLISQSDLPSSNEYVQKHLQLVHGKSWHDNKVNVSEWNAPWDVHHPLLAETRVNTKDIPTITVLTIPSSLDMDDDKIEAIGENFTALMAARRQQNQSH